ncbi:acyltransferase family protein [Micromonospora andamanensis]|uniref:acyltransferase family protein n=1 Tax=Micromonospora andamanensis TaxID=1287068 RepID=UPI00194EA2AE|nr:acyltransferase family protein [Micromonospora andamanensis]GIJ39062.1 acyltransferase [Micromonospora andamanensis]
MVNLVVRERGDVRSGFRGDIEGMRALAVVLVLAGHAAPALLPGGYVGVDVFFVISGFLITGLLLTELERTGRISLVEFYARRARRLLPAAGLVLVVSLLLTFVFLPKIRWAATGWDVVASGLYVMNWRLAERSVDYLAANQAASILQHYWSLAVEEQFYLIWPLLLILVTLGRRGRAWRARPGVLRARLLLGLAVVGVPSFVWSVLLTQNDPAQAYFVTTTRLWELALGAAIAVLGVSLSRMPTAVAAMLAWSGIALIVAAAVLFDETTRFPGYLALLPTVGAAVVIVGAVRAGRAGPAALLGLGPVRAVGAISYSLYLWHWPLLVVAKARFGELSTVTALAVTLFSVIPAVLTYRYVENPLRRAQLFTFDPRAALKLGAACTGVAVAAGLMFQLTVWPPPQKPVVPAALPALGGSTPPPGSLVQQQGPPGAAALGREPLGNAAGRPVDRVDSIVPDPLAAYDDVPDVYAQQCISARTDSTVRTCSYGDLGSDMVVALAGDSHAAHWVPALQAVANANRWRMVTYLKTECPYLDGPVPLPDGSAVYDSCVDWNSELRRKLTGADKPDVLVLSNVTYRLYENGQVIMGDEGVRRTVETFRKTWTEIADTGVKVVVIRDIPYQDMDVPDCVSQHTRRLTRCTTPRHEALSRSEPQVQAASGAPGVHLIDLNDAICPTDRCAAVIGGVLVYRDTSHLTATYARTLASRLRDKLAEVLE